MSRRDRMVGMVVGFTTPMQSMPITSNAVSFESCSGEVY